MELFSRLAILLMLAALMPSDVHGAESAAPQAVVSAYASIARAVYEDAHEGAASLQGAVEAFLADPTPHKLAAARDAWKKARVSYQQSEGLRFGNPYVDSWEGRVNGWPLDEGLIDYVAASYGGSSDENPLYTLNVIAHPRVRIGARQIDASKIDESLLRQLQNGAGVETNVALGYHAIEFLLWGQDLNGTGPGAGERPATDYSLTACTHGNCDRRAAFLRAATNLLVEDLADIAAAWAPGGAARQELASKGAKGGISAILTGIGSLSYGELGGERMKLGLILHDPEEEHDCFSDNTHNSHYYNQVGMIALWRGEYRRTNGEVVRGASLRDHVMAGNPAAARRLDAAMDETLSRLARIKEVADSGRMAYDQMIAANNAEGNALVQAAIDALIAQTRATEGVVAALDLAVSIEGSNSLDNPSAVP